ncbi:MAG: Succinate--CoA ligase [ADP-forming] subunit beta [Chlamydiia bacterium]|nr:Succinate--CoA ligase [ADP-forming] subunit beta [Chlamydiia bacterium]
MHIHEYQAKEILKEANIPVPAGIAVSNRQEAEEAIKKMGIDQGVVKIQVHAGGRGKAGGVKIGRSKDELLTLTDQLIGLKMVNNQTGPEGIVSHQVLISELTDIDKEYYIGAVISREDGRAMIICSPEGGMEIEEIAHKTPEKIMTQAIALDGTLTENQLEALALFMGFEGKDKETFKSIIKNIAKTFLDIDASLVEINPFVKTKNGELVALDAKISVDDNALFRQPEIAEMFDPTQISPAEVEAHKADLAYIKLDGTIGCMVNGAGLAMATMDIIQHYGGTPANFLDVGGGASAEKVAKGFGIILSDPNVKGILVNIFGGIMKCDVIAEGILIAAKRENIKVPLVVGLEGTNVEQGKKILAESGLNIITAVDLKDGAQKIVKECE